MNEIDKEILKLSKYISYLEDYRNDIRTLEKDIEKDSFIESRDLYWEITFLRGKLKGLQEAREYVQENSFWKKLFKRKGKE